MRGDDLVRDVETEPDSFALGARDAEEFLEDPLAVLGRDPRPLILHFETDVLVVRPRTDLDRSAAGAVPDGVADQIVEDQADALGIDEDRQHRRADFFVELYSRVLGRVRLGGDRRFDHGLRRQRRQRDLHLPRLDAREIEQVVHDSLQPLAILASGVQQIGLAIAQRSDGAFHQDVDGHAQRSERRAELVRDGGDEVVLQLVEAEQARHVLQHDGGPDHPALLRVERSRARQEGAVAALGVHADRLLQTSWSVGPFARDDVGTHFLDRVSDVQRHARERLGAAADLQKRLCRLVHVEDAALDGEDEHRVGHAVDGRLRCLLRLQQLAQRAVPVLAQPVRHQVQLAAHLRDLVLAAQSRASVEVALADAAHRQREEPQRAQRAPRQPQ